MRQKIIQLKTFLFTPKCRFSIRNSQIPAMSNLTESCFPSKPKSNCTDFISLSKKHIYPEYICLRLNLSWHFLPSRFSIKHKHSWVFDLVFFSILFIYICDTLKLGVGWRRIISVKNIKPDARLVWKTHAVFRWWIYLIVGYIKAINSKAKHRIIDN